MGLYASAPENISAIAAEMRTAVLPWLNGAIQIVKPNIAGSSHDPFTNAVTNSVEPEVLWSGPARIQPIRTPLDAQQPYGETTIAAMRFQIPIDALQDGVIHKGLRIYITNAGEDPALTELQFAVRRAINSSFAWIRTIECEVDMGADSGR